ncbi:MAG: ABC transporter ATP-binding protein [Spirochaetales bacterium]|nr:ABC transporter ATP-binding protein [Spirochaetales bacterium]
MSVNDHRNQETPALILEGICQEFRSETGDVNKVLDTINLTVNKEEFVAVVGPSGCGKTTLLNIIGGFLPPVSGEVFIEGKPAGRPNRDRGIVYQDYALFPWMTVLDNIVYGIELEKINYLEKYINIFKYRKVRKDAIEKAKYYLEETGLSDAAHKYPHQLSGGMRQRVAIAQALIMEPKILLMDEPFGALDVQTREALQILMLRIREDEHNTVFFVTHDLEEALYIGSRVVVLSQYHNVKDGKFCGAQIVYDEILPPELNFLSTDLKDTSQFRDMVGTLMKVGFEPGLNKEIEAFNEQHPQSSNK